MLRENDLLIRIEVKVAVAEDVAVGQRNNRYSVGELLLTILYPMILGLARIEPCALLQAHSLFRRLSNLAPPLSQHAAAVDEQRVVVP